MASFALELRQLRKAYSPSVVPVANLSLQLQPGEFLTLLGPSGCGKSTTLRLIAGLDQPTSGSLWLGDREITNLPPGDRDMAMVFQSYALYPHLSVRQNLTLGLQIRRMPPAEIEQRLQQVAHNLELEHLLDRRPAQLSGGQRQRVALGRALVRQPSVFLLDEPLSNLDALLREQVRAQMKALFSQQASPVVYVTHDQTEALSLSHRIAILNGGHLQQLDRPDRIYQAPANAFVAGFIGSPRMNLLPLPVQSAQAWLGTHALPTPPHLASRSQVLWGLRPEHLKLATVDADSAIPVQLQLTENLGMQRLLTVAIAATPELQLRLLVPTDQPIPTDLQVTFDSQTQHWFCPVTDERL
ncbi:ABC transporter ATP-binding protein [Synechococcus elongatus IITB7]|uniref:ABC transporter ATP-binding protein n=1 Tax=Synechococcus elongatus TaxID=32046 RepID=UPI0030CCA96F